MLKLYSQSFGYSEQAPLITQVSPYVALHVALPPTTIFKRFENLFYEKNGSPIPLTSVENKIWLPAVP